MLYQIKSLCSTANVQHWKYVHVILTEVTTKQAIYLLSDFFIYHSARVKNGSFQEHDAASESVDKEMKQ